MPYRVKRNLPDNSYVQLKSATLPECKSLLKSIRDKWEDLSDNGSAFGEEPFVVTLENNRLVVTRGERVVDEYVIEETK